MKRSLYIVANLPGGVVLVAPTRPLAPVFVLLGLAVVFAVLPRFLPRRPSRAQLKFSSLSPRRRSIFLLLSSPVSG
jgi:hypothetical protein